MSSRAEFLRKMGISEEDVLDPEVVTSNYRKSNVKVGETKSFTRGYSYNDEKATSSATKTSTPFKKPPVVDMCKTNDMLFCNGFSQECPNKDSNKDDTLISYAKSKMPGIDGRNSQQANFPISRGIDDNSVCMRSNDTNGQSGDAPLSHSEIIRQRRAKFKSEMLAQKKEQDRPIDYLSHMKHGVPEVPSSTTTIKGRNSAYFSNGDRDAIGGDQHASQEYAIKSAAATVEEEERKLRQDGYRMYDHHRGAYSDGNGGTYESFCKAKEAHDFTPTSQRQQQQTNYGTSRGKSDTEPSIQSSTKNDASKNLVSSVVNSRDETHTMTVSQLKDLGNKLFEQGDFRKAVRMYSSAIDIDPTNAALYSNRSAAYLQASKQMGIDTRAMSLRDSNKVIELRPTWYKGYSRKADALFKMERFPEAVKMYEEALKYDEGNINLIHSLGEARNSCGGRGPLSRDQWDNGFLNEKDKSADVEKIFKGRSARQLAEELRGEISTTIGSVAVGNDFKELEMEKFRAMNDTHNGTTSSLNWTQSDIGSGCCDGDAIVSSNRKGRQSDHRNERRVPISAYDGQLYLPNNDYDKSKIDTSHLPPGFDSDAAAAYQERLLEEYRNKKKKKQGC